MMRIAGGCVWKSVRRLSELEYAGEYIIEREITGEQQSREIEETVTYLSDLLPMFARKDEIDEAGR